MKRNYINRIVFVFLWFVFLGICSGCQQREDIKTDMEKVLKNPEKTKEKTKEKTLRTEIIQWQNGIQKPERLEALYCKNDIVYLIGRTKKDYRLYTMDMKGENQQEKKIKKLPKEIEQIDQMVTDGQGSYAMILSENSYTAQSKYYYTEYTERENELEQTGIWEFEKPESITSIGLDMGQAIAVYNMTNAELYKKYDNDEFSNIDGNRKHVVTCQQSLGLMLDGGEFWNVGNEIEKWDIAENKKLFSIDFDRKISGFVFFAHADEENHSAYFTNNDGVYGCKEDGSIELLLEWFANDVNGGEVTCFGGNGEVFFAGDREGVFYRIAEHVSKGISDDREIITIATTSDVGNIGFVLAYIQEFNSSQKQYWIRISTYGTYENPEERLRIDMTTGKIPDIILIKEETENLFERLNRKGMLEDLYEYIDADPEIAREDFVENTLKLLEIDKKLTSIAGNFTIHALVGKKELIGDRTSWTWEEFQECCKELPEGSAPYTGVPATIFRQAFPTIYSQYFDLQMEQSFKGAEDFAKDIKLAESVFQPKEQNGASVSMSSLNEVINKVRKGEFYLCSYSMVWMPFVLQPDLAMLDEPQELALIGYPSSTGTGVSMSFGEQYAITSFSKHKEGAWEFLKKLLVSNSDSVYTCIMGSLPLQKTGYEFNKKCMLAKEDYIDEDGRTIYALGANSVFHVTKEDVEMLEQMIKMADCKRLNNAHPLKIIVEEELSQYEREKDLPLEQTIEYIRDRVKIYFSEQE